MESMQQVFPGQSWGPYLVRGYPEPPPQYEDGSGSSTHEPNPPPPNQQWGPFCSRVDATGSALLYCFQTMSSPTPFLMPVPATAGPLMEPMFAMGIPSLPLEALYASQSCLESMACSPLCRIPNNSSFAYPFTGPKALPLWSQFSAYNLPLYELGSPESASEMIASSYGQDFARTPTPLSSPTSWTGSQASSVWESCSTTGTSLSSISDSTSQMSDLGTGHNGDMFYGSRAASRPGPIDAEENIWEVDMLLGKWTRGKTTWYLVKWKGFDNSHNTWEKQRNIYGELVDEFEATYQGNDFAIERLLGKRTRRGGTEYLVEWKGWGSDDSWEKEVGLSRARVMEFEARK